MRFHCHLFFIKVTLTLSNNKEQKNCLKELMKELLSLLGIREEDGKKGSFGGKTFERIFHQLCERTGESPGLLWPLMTPADAKTFRNQATKILQRWHDAGSLRLPEGWSVRRSMLDDGCKCGTVLECVARMVLMDALKDVESITAGEREISRLEALLAQRMAERDSLKSQIADLKRQTITGIQLNQELWNHFAKTTLNSQNSSVDYSFKKVIRQMARATTSASGDREERDLLEGKKRRVQMVLDEWHHLRLK